MSRDSRAADTAATAVQKRQLIVNADDFGMARGVNDGIVAAHAEGIVTSTTLLVDGAAAEHALELAAAHPQLRIGLHFTAEPAVMHDRAALAGELERQLRRFGELAGRPPSHVDSHRHVHLRALPIFTELAHALRLAVRGDGAARLIRTFYAHGGDRSLVSAARLRAILAVEVQPGTSELMCHPGLVSDDLVSSYRDEREAELRTLTDRRLHAVLAELGIARVSY